MDFFKTKWFGTVGLVLFLSACWWQFGPRAYELVYRGHKFEYLEPLSASTNRSALLRFWVGYEGRRPRWWGQPVKAGLEGLHEWTFSNGIPISGGGGFPAVAEFNADKDCYQFDIDRGLTAYRVENGKMVAVASGLATHCKFTVRFEDPQKRDLKMIPMSLELTDGHEIFTPNQ